MISIKKIFYLSLITLSGVARSYGAPVKISSESQFNQEISSHTLVVAKFSAPWCGPCKALAPIFARTSNQSSLGTIRFLEINTDELSTLAHRFNIHSVPTIIFLKNGQEVFRHKGAPSAHQLTDLITQKLLN